MGNELFKCCKAGIVDYCGVCQHGEPHERYALLTGQRCTAWGECNLGESYEETIIKVRCVKVKEEK